MTDPAVGATGSSGGSITAPPYEEVLKSAFNKLTSEILIFLLAYTILLIGVALFGSDLASELRTLLYVIPILGVAAYVWLKRRDIAQEERKRQVNVRSGIATGGAIVAGIRGQGVEAPEHLGVRSGFAGSGARVVGIDASGEPEARAAEPASERYLLDLFGQLNPLNQRQLVASAQSILDTQAETDDSRIRPDHRPAGRHLPTV